MTAWFPALEGFIPFTIYGETHQTFYRVFGDLQNKTRTPLVVLHGGPGLAHDYMLPISDISSSRPVIFYDQIGNSRSTHLPDKPATFWTVDLFLDELENVLRHFKITDDYDLIGHSWGGMMAAELEIRRHPAGLRRIILTNSLAKMSMWRESNAQLLKAFPKDIQDAMAIGMRDLKVSGPAMKKFREKHGCLVHPFPEEYVYTLNQLFAEDSDASVTKAM
jgi:proline-specific peptidase